MIFPIQIGALVIHFQFQIMMMMMIKFQNVLIVFVDLETLKDTVGPMRNSFHHYMHIVVGSVRGSDHLR